MPVAIWTPAAPLVGVDADAVLEPEAPVADAALPLAAPTADEPAADEAGAAELPDAAAAEEPAGTETEVVSDAAPAGELYGTTVPLPAETIEVVATGATVVPLAGTGTGATAETLLGRAIDAEVYAAGVVAAALLML